MDPITNQILQAIAPLAGAGSTLERNALIGVIRNLISEDKYTVDYILNFAESVGYSRKMAEDVFKELTGLSPALIVNNNEYYNMPSYVPNMCIAWGISKSNKEKAFYIAPFEYGYAVMEKDEVNAPIPTVISATIPEAFEELKKVAKNIQTLDKIITKKLLETENIQSTAKDVHDVNLPYSISPLQVLKKSFKDKVLSVAEFEKQASQMVLAGELTVDEAEDLMTWKQDLIEEDESYANEVLQETENWGEVKATVEFQDVINEVKMMANDDEDFIGFEGEAKKKFEANKELFQNVDLIEAATRLYQLLLGFSKEEILGHSKFEKKESFQDIETLKHIVKNMKDEGKTRHNAIIYLQGKVQPEVIGEILEYAGFNKQASKKVTAENMTLEDIEAEDSKDRVQEEIEKIEEKPTEEIFSENTPAEYFEDSLQEDKVDTINEVVSKCIDKFSEKFKDFNKYNVQILSYNTKVLGDYEPTEDELVEDKELNANAILQVILSITNKADESEMKKVLAVFSVANGELHWTGTVRGENDQVVAFTEEGLDALFEVEEVADQELEDII